MDEQQKRQLESEICAVVQGMRDPTRDGFRLRKSAEHWAAREFLIAPMAMRSCGLFWRSSRMSWSSMRCRSPGKTPVFFVKPRGEGEPEPPADRPKPAAAEPGKQKVPTSEMHLTDWTFVPWALRDHLAELCLPEKWYYGDKPEPGKELSILNNYLDNTFRRLCYEGESRYSSGPCQWGGVCCV